VTAREHRKKTNRATKGVHAPATGTSAEKNSRPDEYQKQNALKRKAALLGIETSPKRAKL